MNVRFFLYRVLGWIAITLGLGSLAVVSALPRLVPVLWFENSFAWMLAPVLLAFSALLGLLFRQVRISLLAFVVAMLLWRLHSFAPGTAQALVLAYLAEPVVPLAATIFLLIPEQRIFTEWGIARVCLACFFAGMLFMIPELDYVQTWFVEHPIPSVISAIHLSVPAVLALLCLVTAAILIRRHEAPNLGPFFVAIALHVMLLCSASSLAERIGLPGRELQEAFAVSCAVLLVWISIDCGWRNAFMDELTQLPGRRPMRHHFASLGYSFTLATVDIDHFKRINDRYGHDIGDQVLRLIAFQLRAFRYGTAYRFGGEEFSLVMKRDEFGEQVAQLDALREQIATRPFVLRGQDRPNRRPSTHAVRSTRSPDKEIHITVSIGVAHTDNGDDPDDILTAADQALYRAKKGGRNRVCAAKS